MKKPSNKNLNRQNPSKSYISAPIRITSGALRGHTLISPNSPETHPMGSREKIALFNMLMVELRQADPATESTRPESYQITPSATESPRPEPYRITPSATESAQSAFQNLQILDAYAGSGALGIEAISRGAKNVIFVEKSPAVAKIIRKNLQNLRLSGHFEVKNQSIAKFIHQNSKTGQFDLFRNNPDKTSQFDLILADPPYSHFDPAEISDLATLLAPGGILALSHPGVAPEIKNLTLLKTRAYARARISLYRRNPN